MLHVRLLRFDFFLALAGAPVRAARGLGFGTAGSNFLLPLHFLARTAASLSS